MTKEIFRLESEMSDALELLARTSGSTYYRHGAGKVIIEASPFEAFEGRCTDASQVLAARMESLAEDIQAYQTVRTA